MDGAGIGMTITRDHGDHLERVYTNRAAAEVLGYPVEQVVKMPPMMPIAPDEMPKILALRERFKRGEALPSMIDTVVIGKDGRRIPVEVGLAMTSFQGHPVTVAFVRDVTRRKDVESELRESEQRFRSLAEAAPDTITVISEGRFVYANPRTAELMGFESPEEFMKRPLVELVVPEDRRRMGERIARALGGETLPPSEYRGIHKDGSIVTLEISSMTVTYGGKPAVLAIGRDVQARKEREAEMIRTDRLAAIGQLAAGVAHEINNPLSYVLLRLDRMRHGLAELVDQVPAARRVADNVHDALEGAERIRDVVSDLLSFARLQDEAPAPLDLRMVLESALKLASHAIGSTAALECELAGVPVVHSNRARLGQVFLNVLLNAAQAFGRRDPTRDKIRVELTRDGADHVRVDVIDNGDGIPPEHLDRIFEPFFTTKSAGRGTGLGLAITKSIVDDLGGEIGVTSKLGTGTAVSIRLPIGAPVVRKAAGDEAPPDAREHTRSRVAIIDDEAALARALADALGEEHLVEVYTDSRVAFDALSHQSYDVVVCDLLMPGMTGMELFQRIVERHPSYEARFLFITGGLATPAAAAFADTHEADILAKPFDVDLLRGAIAQRLR